MSLYGLAAAASLDAPAGRYRDVFSGREHDLDRRVPVDALVGAHAVALLERV